MSRGHRRAEERSIALHRAVAERLAADPSLVELGRARLERWATSGAMHPTVAAAWREILRLPLDELCARLVDRSQAMIDLRQSSPFAGALSPRERWAVLRVSSPEDPA